MVLRRNRNRMYCMLLLRAFDGVKTCYLLLHVTIEIYFYYVVSIMYSVSCFLFEGTTVVVVVVVFIPFCYCRFLSFVSSLYARRCKPYNDKHAPASQIR